MPKTASHASTTFSEENIQLAKDELQKLAYQLKKTDADRKTYCVQTEQFLWKQRKVIEHLEKEVAEMFVDIRVIKSESIAKKDNMCRIALTGLLDVQDQTRKDIENATVQIKILDGEIRVAEKKLQHQRREMVVVHKNQAKVSQNLKKIALLDNRLNHGNVKYSELLTVNGDVRKNIDSMLKLRTRFNNAYVRIKKLMKAGKRKIMETVQDATLAYHQRDETQYRIQVLRERSNQDQVQLAEQIKDLHRMVEHDENMKTFMNRKVKDRIPDMRDKKNIDFLLKESSGSQGSNDRLQICRVIFKRITIVAHADEVKVIILRFRQVEDKNFALFNYITELNNDAEKLQDVVQSYQKEIDELQNKYREHHKKEYQDYQNLEAKAEEVKKEVKAAEETVETYSRTLELVKAEVNKLLQLTKCSESGHEYLGGKEGIMDHNIIQHLGILEEKIIEFLELYKYLQYKLQEGGSQEEGASEKSVLSSHSPSFTQSTPLISAKDIAPPDLGENIKYYEDVNLSDVPLSTDQLRAAAVSSLQKKHSALTSESKSRKGQKM